MDTLPKDLLTLIFKVCNDNSLVDSLSLLYGQDFLRIKYQHVCKYIDTELNKLFGEQRYELFKEDSVLTGSLLLMLILQYDRLNNCDVDIVTTNPNFDVGSILKLKPKEDFRDTIESWGFNNPLIHNDIRKLLNIKSSSITRFMKLRTPIDTTLIDSTQLTIKDHIEHSDYEFLMNYAYYKDGDLQLFVANYLSVFNKESDFKLSTIVWRSPVRYHKYRYRGFNIKWDHSTLEHQIDSYIEYVDDVLKTRAYNFFILTCSDKYSAIINKLNCIADQKTVIQYLKIFILTELMKQMADTDNSVLYYNPVVPDEDDWI